MRGRGRGGFTLIELLIYLSIFAVIGVLGATVLDFTLRNKVATTRTNEVYIAVERTVSQIVDRVHAANSITSGSGSTLQLAMSSGAINPTTFSLESNAVTIKEGANASSTLTPSTIFVTGLSFTKINNTSSSVQIVITAGKAIDGAADATTLYRLQTTALPL